MHVDSWSPKCSCLEPVSTSHLGTYMYLMGGDYCTCRWCLAVKVRESRCSYFFDVNLISPESDRVSTLIPGTCRYFRGWTFMEKNILLYVHVHVPVCMLVLF